MDQRLRLPEIHGSPPAWAAFPHRPAIDGLRAVAALLVVLFHAGAPGMGGGYVGVDVFFVLSGFLITSLLARESLHTGRISLTTFYARRMRRLLPAALVVLTATVVAFRLLASPLDLLHTRWDASAAALYASNWLFLSRSQNYFAEDAAPSPFTHYWSLSVEEQYYLLWPLLLGALLTVSVVARRLGPLVVGALAAVALALSHRLAESDASAAYFHTVARAYQLLLGAALAMVLLWRARAGAQTSPRTSSIASSGLGLGLLLLLFSASGLGPDAAWPAGLLAVIATVVILTSLELGATGRVHTALTSAPARWLGIWSYAIYLWQWPVVVLGDDAGWLPASWPLRTPAVLAVSVGLAAATWAVVERPVSRIRMPRLVDQRRVVLAGLIATLGVAAACAVLLHPSARAQALEGEVTRAAAPVSGPVVAGDAAASSTVLLVGDSHARMWRAGLESYAAEHGFRVVSVTQAACPWAAVNAVSEDTGDSFDCQTKLVDPMLRAAAEYRPQLVVLFSRSITVRHLELPDGSKVAPTRQDRAKWEAAVSEGMRDSLDRLAPLTGGIVVVEPLPETGESMLECLSRSSAAAKGCDLPQADTWAIRAAQDVERGLASDDPAIRTVSLDDLICPDGVCPAQVDGRPTHRDVHHLTEEYAASLVPALDAALRQDGIDLRVGTLRQG